MDLNLLEDLCGICGVSCDEEDVACFIVDYLARNEVICYKDVCGNVVAEFLGEDHGRRILITAHIDEVGFMVADISENGIIYASPIGGTPPDGYYHVVTRNGVSGILHKFGTGFFPIDMGFMGREEAVKQVSLGDTLTYMSNYFEQGDFVFSKALDNRVSVFALIEAISLVKKYKYDTTIVFTTREEISGKGAIHAVKCFSPDMLLVVDTTEAKSCLDKAENTNVEVGGGVYIKIADACTHVSPDMSSRLCKLAQQACIKHNKEVCLLGTTELFYVEREFTGIPYAAISMPTREIHTDFTSINKKDLQCLIDFLCVICSEGV